MVGTEEVIVSGGAKAETNATVGFAEYNRTC